MKILRYLAALVATILVVGVSAMPAASADPGFSSTNPYCIAFMNRMGTDATPYVDCYPTKNAESLEEYYWVDQQGGHLLATLYNGNYFYEGDGYVDLVAPSPTGGCKAYTYYVDHMPSGWNDKVSSIYVWAPYCNVGRWFTDAYRQGTKFDAGYNHGPCGIEDLNDFYMDNKISSFTLGRWDDNPSYCPQNYTG